MTLLKPQQPGGSTPVPSRFSLPYWEGCALGELRIIRCQDCGQAIVDAPRICWRCHGRDLRWEVATGDATLYSWTIVWRPQTPDFEVPYAVAIVTLDESVELVSSVVGCEPGDLVEGMTLTVEFHAISAEMKLPYFRPARS